MRPSLVSQEIGWSMDIKITPNSMNYTETQLAAIRLFWRKDLEFWCILSTTWWIWKIYKNDDNHVLFIVLEDWDLCILRSTNFYEIFWHIPHLEDLFRVADEKGFRSAMIYTYEEGNERCITLWKKWEFWTDVEYNPTLPLLNQPNLQDILNIFK